MKNLLYTLSALLGLVSLAQIPGTIPVNGPIAPNATNNNYAVVDGRYVQGGQHDEFTTAGQWQDRNWLPLNRMRIGMTVKSQDDTNTVYVLRSITPEVWQPIPVNPLGTGDHGDISAANSFLGTGTTLLIDNGAVTYPKLQNTTAPQVFLGRGQGAAGQVVEIQTGTGFTWAGNVVSVTGGGGGGSATNQTVIGVALLADMTNLAPAYLTGTAPVFVQTGGRTVTGVGGALYLYKPSSTETPNLGTVFAHSSLPGRLVYADVAPPNVDMFGAIPDFGGVNNGDDTAAFANAMSVLPVGSTLLLNIGTYRAVGIVNTRGINMIGLKASRPSKFSIDAGISGFPAWGLGSEIEANGAGWIYSVGRPLSRAHTLAPDDEYMYQPTITENISFFGFKRTLDAGGMQVYNADNQRILNCNFYCLSKAGLWIRRAVRESVVRDCDFRFCGNADTTDPECPDPVKGWASLMLFDDQEPNAQISDHSNFNLYENNQVSFSLGCAVILDTKQPYSAGPDVVFNERFRNNIWHGYNAPTGKIFSDVYAASANMYNSPLMIVRCSTRIDIEGDLFWFTGANAPHLKFEDNTTTITNAFGASLGSTYGRVENCGFGFYYNNAASTTGIIRVDTNSTVYVGNQFFYGNNGGDTGQPRIVNNGAVLDSWMSAGRSVFSSVKVNGVSTFGGYLQLPHYTTTAQNALTGLANGELLYNSTLNKLTLKTPSGWKSITLDP